MHLHSAKVDALIGTDSGHLWWLLRHDSVRFPTIFFFPLWLQLATFLAWHLTSLPEADLEHCKCILHGKSPAQQTPTIKLAIDAAFFDLLPHQHSSECADLFVREKQLTMACNTKYPAWHKWIAESSQSKTCKKVNKNITGTLSFQQNLNWIPNVHVWQKVVSGEKS